jgi:hypothetical protein
LDSGTTPRSAFMTRRRLQLALGFLWLLDGALQLQPFMFTGGFASKVLAPTADGQPGWVARPVLSGAHLIGTHPALFNGLFAAAQLLLGLAFLLRPTVRAAILASLAWSAGVWFLGEGLGGLAGGAASILNGAPGAVALYGVLALAAWPRLSPNGSTWSRRLLTSSSQDEVPPLWLAWAWAATWIGFAVLSALPANRSAGAVAGQLRNNADQVPGWLASLDRAAAAAVQALGPATTVLMIAVPVVIALFGLRDGRMRRFAAWGGIAYAAVVWVVGQSFGFLFSGSATDPNAGPLLVLFGLALLTVRGGVSLPAAMPSRPGPRVRRPTAEWRRRAPSGVV